MTTIALRVDVEEVLIEAKIPRREWANYANEATLMRLKQEKKK